MTPDKDTIQWCVDEIDKLVAQSIADRKKKKKKANATDEKIAAVAIYLAGRYNRAIREAKAG